MYAEPFLEVTSWSEDDIVALLGKQYSSLSEWREEVLVLQAAENSNQDAAMIRTAVKAVKTLPRLQEGDSKVNFGFQLRLEPVEVEGGPKSQREGDAVLQLENTPALESWEIFGSSTIGKINLLQTSLVDLSKSMRLRINELQVGLMVRIKGLEDQIGTGTGDYTYSSLGNSSVMQLLEDHQAQLEELKNEDHLEAVAGRVMSSRGFVSQADKIKEAFKAVMQRVLPLEKQVSELVNAKMDAEDSSEWLGLGVHTETKIDAKWEEKLDSVITRVSNLEVAVVPLGKGEGEDVSISFMGVRFSSEEDVKSYVESMNGGKFNISPGLVTDCYSIFHALNREIFDAKSKLNMVDLAKVSSLGAKQTDVYHLLAVAEHGLPDFFDSASSSNKIFIDGKQGKKHHFNNIATYEIWGPVGTIKDAVRKREKVQLTRFVKTKRLAIQEISSPELCAFLIAMLNASKEFVEAVFLSLLRNILR